MNPRKSNHEPTVDAPAVGEVEAVLARAAKFIEALQDTHSAIPAALAEEMHLSGQWGNAAITGHGDVVQMHAQLGAVRERREADVRRRAAAAAGLLQLEGELAQARAAADQERSQLATAVVNEFNSRWNHACRELAKLHAEAQQLSAALHARVNCPPPYMPVTSVANGLPEVRLSVPLEPQPLTLPAPLTSVVSTLDRLDGVLAMIGGVKQAREFDVRHYQLAVLRGTPTELGGVFRVIAEFVCPMDGLPFQAGALIDHSLIGHGHLQRLTVGRRFVQPVELESAAA